MNARESVTWDTVALEEVLMMKEWGKWARQDGGNGLVYPRWVREIRGNYEEEKAYADIGGIDEDYAVLLDRLIASLDDWNWKCILVELYVYRNNVSSLSRILRKNRHDVRQARDAALGFLYGALTAKSA